jgi:hypothetical protein
VLGVIMRVEGWRYRGRRFHKPSPTPTDELYPRGPSVVSALLKANESWILVGSGVPCHEQEVTVSNRHPVLRPLVRDPRAGRVLRSLAPRTAELRAVLRLERSTRFRRRYRRR